MLQRAATNAAAERKALLGGRSPGDKHKKLQSDEDALHATQDVTASLQRTRQMLVQVRAPPSSIRPYLGQQPTKRELSDHGYHAREVSRQSG